MIGDLISTLSDAQKLSIAQIQKAVQDGTLPAYVGIPLLQDKVKQRNEAAALLMGQKPKQPKVAEQVMAAADQAIGIPSLGGPAAPVAAGEETEQAMPNEGLESLSSNLPQEYAGGGIIAFDGGGDVPEGDDYTPVPNVEADKRLLEQYRSGFTPSGVMQWATTPIGGPSVKPAAEDYYKTTTPPPSRAVQEPVQGGVGLLQGAKDWYRQHVQPTVEMLTAPGETTKPTEKGEVKPIEDKKTPDTSKVTLTKNVSMPGARQAARTQKAIQQLTPPTTPESTISAAPPKEDTSIADEIARSRSERDDMMKMILGDQAADKKEAEENKWLSLAKAGFGIAGGRSPYAMVNIGEGMSGGIGDIMAAKEMARKQEQGKIQAAADYEAKSQQLENAMREMGISQQHYKSMEPYYAAQTQKALSDAEYNRVLTGLAPQKLALQAAKGAGGGGQKPLRITPAMRDKVEQRYDAFDRNLASSPAITSLTDPVQKKGYLEAIKRGDPAVIKKVREYNQAHKDRYYQSLQGQ